MGFSRTWTVTTYHFRPISLRRERREDVREARNRVNLAADGLLSDQERSRFGRSFKLFG